MGRDAGRHTYGDPLGTVYQKIGNLHRQNRRLLLRLVEIGDEIHHILIQISQKCLLGHPGKPGLRISHGSGAVSLDVAEIAVAVYQGQSFFEILGHDYQRIVYGRVSMGMIFTHGITHNTGAFPVRPVITDAQLIHIIQSTPLYGL